MTVSDATVQRVLLAKRLLTKEQIESAVLLAPSLGKSFLETILLKNYLAESVLGPAIAESLGVPYVNLAGQKIAGGLLDLIPEATATSYQIIGFSRQGDTLAVAMADPSNFEAINFLQKKTGLTVKPFFAFESQIQTALGQYKRNIQLEVQSLLASVEVNQANLAKVAEELPTIKLLETILDYAIAEGASDIHFEGQENSTLVRFRLDGRLKDVLVLESRVQPAVIARIKYLSNLKIDEHRLPQDGRFAYSKNASKVALRVSILPTYFGENIVMRLLPENARTQTLVDLGFSPANIEKLKHQIGRPNGIILLTGPTGSGKTTTLYTLIEMLNQPEVKIATIEDPIEYGIARVSQSQVNNETGFTFAKGLRALLRHDPNIIMVGEIRDQETADIALNAALTGHLVLSTLHTNDATTAPARLLDLGVESFLVGSTVRLVVAQRLVRQLCPSCRQPQPLDAQTMAELTRLSGWTPAQLQSAKLYRPVGCAACSEGYRGRLGIHELFVVDETVRELLATEATGDKLRAYATSHGMLTLLQDGLTKVMAGLTTLDEVRREADREDTE